MHSAKYSFDETRFLLEPDSRSSTPGDNTQCRHRISNVKKHALGKMVQCSPTSTWVMTEIACRDNPMSSACELGGALRAQHRREME